MKPRRRNLLVAVAAIGVLLLAMLPTLADVLSRLYFVPTRGTEGPPAEAGPVQTFTIRSEDGLPLDAWGSARATPRPRRAR